MSEEKIKNLLTAGVFTLLVVAIFFALRTPVGEPVIGEPVIDEPVARGAGAPKVPYQTCINFDDLQESAVYSLVKLTDTVNYPHDGGSQIILKSLLFSGDLSANQDWCICVGVITGTDSTEGGFMPVYRLHRHRQANFIEQVTWPEHGLNLVIDDDVAKYAGGIGIVSPWFSSTVLITSSVGTSHINVGDLVMYIEEHTSGADLDLSLCAAYDTE